MPVLSLACHLSHNTPHIPSRYNNEQTTKQTKAINNSYTYINISCKCDTNRAGHFTLDAYASRPVACGARRCLLCLPVLWICLSERNLWCNHPMCWHHSYVMSYDIGRGLMRGCHGKHCGLITRVAALTLMTPRRNLFLIHLPLDKMATIPQSIFSDAFSWMKRFVF